MSLNILPILIQLTFKYSIFYSIIKNILNTKFPIKNIIFFFFVILSISGFFCISFVDSIFLSPLLSILLILIGSVYFLKVNFIDALVSTTLYSITNYIAILICILIDFDLQNQELLSLEVLIFCILTTFLYKLTYSSLFQNFIEKIKAIYNDNIETNLFLLLILLSFNPINILNKALFFNILTVQIFTLLFSLYAIYKQFESANTILKLNTTIAQNYAMQNLVDKVRTFKHDYNNTLCSIGGYISLNDMDGLKNFYSRLNFDMQATNNIQLINSNNINEPSIYNLLTSKHKIILQNNIKFEFYSCINYKSLQIPSYELSKILGILLDNAIDAAILSKEKEISLTCKTNNNYYLISLKNTYINKNISLEEIYKKGFSTKKIKSGLGLWEVSRILEDFSEITLITKKDDSHFTQTLQIPLKETLKVSSNKKAQ